MCVLKPSSRGRGAQVASAQAGASQFIEGASFGEAAFANMSKGKAYLIFCEKIAMLPRGTICSQFFCKGRGQNGALDCRGVCALGVACAQADAPQFVMGARLGEAAWAQCARGPRAFSRFGIILPGCLGGLNFCILAAINRDRSGVHDGRGVLSLGGYLMQGWLRAPYHHQIGGRSRPS